MKIRNKKFLVFSLLFTSLLFACEDLTETNINPNGIEPNKAHPNLLMSTVLTETGNLYVNLGYQDIAGVVQHTQKDAWSSGHNDYDWGGSQDWSGYYAILRNNDLMYNRAVELNLEFHQGVALVMRSFVFGLITDLWGDAPYTTALKGESGELNGIQPAFTLQQEIYEGILADLETANALLSKSPQDYTGVVAEVDAYYGDVSGYDERFPELWRKFANSLALRYYMRISGKLPAVAQAGIEKIVNDPAQYPLITSPDEEVTMEFPGDSPGTSWPANTAFDQSESNYKRIKMAATLVESLQAKNDPRLAVWASKVEIPLVVDAGLPANTDEIIDGVRYLSPDKVGTALVDTDPEYVDIPTSFSALPSIYNMNPTPGQTSNNPHVSFLNEIYKAPSGDLLQSRLLSAAEVHFILAESALKGWAVGSDKDHYDAGVQASLETWEVGDEYSAYIAQPGVEYNAAGTFDEKLAQIMEQKWIASWTAATEAWFDFRRTGLPALQAGPAANRGVLPVRFYYGQSEIMLNSSNANDAIGRLEITGFSQADGNNSAWSKPWIIQGTGKPWE